MRSFRHRLWRGSIHVAVPDTFTADQIDKLGRDIQTIVYGKHHVFLATVGIYSVNTKDEEISRIQSRVAKIVMAHKYVKQMHGFYLEKDKKEIRFDVVVSFDAKDRKKVCEDVLDEVRAAFPDYTVRAALDLDFAEV